MSHDQAKDGGQTAPHAAPAHATTIQAPVGTIAPAFEAALESGSVPSMASALMEAGAGARDALMEQIQQRHGNAVAHDVVRAAQGPLSVATLGAQGAPIGPPAAGLGPGSADADGLQLTGGDDLADTVQGSGTAIPHRRAGKRNPNDLPLAAEAKEPVLADPIVLSAADEAKHLPARILALRKLSNDLVIARDHLDGDSVGAIGLKLAAAYEAAAAGLQRLDEGVDNADLLGAVGVDYSWDPNGDKSAKREAELTRLKETKDDLTLDLAAWSTLIANAVKPRTFRHHDVPGAEWVIRPDDMPQFIREQTVRSILLLDTLDEIKAMLEGAKGQPPDVGAALRKEAAARLQFWLGDHDGFLFLGYALGKLGHGDVLDERGMDGKALRKTVEAVTRGVPQTVPDVLDTVREARDRDLAGDHQGALALLDLARERVDELASYGRIKEALPKGVHGLTLESAQTIAQEGRDGVRELTRALQRGHTVGEGTWNHLATQLRVASPVLTVTSGESAYDESFLTAIAPASRTTLIATGIAAGTVVAGGAGATWISANAAAIAEVTLGAYTAAVAMIVRNPYAATAIAEFAASIGFNVIESGGIENFLEQLKTPEGVLQLTMDILVLKQSLGGGRIDGDADAPDAPRRAPADLADEGGFGAQVRDVLDRVRALKGATIEWAKQPRRPGMQPDAATPDGATVRVPGGKSDDLPDFSTIYAERLTEQRNIRAARGGRRIWPTVEEWDSEYQHPPAGKTAAEVREKLLSAAKRKYPVSDEMTNQEKTTVYWKQKAFFDGVEDRARAKRNELREQLADASPEDREQIRTDLDGAETMLEASLVKPVQGRLPINHEFAGRSVTLEHIDEKIADLTIEATERVRLQEARVVMVEMGINEVRFTRDGYPDFSPFVYQRNGIRADVEINLQRTRGRDDRQADDAYRAKIGDDEWDRPDGYTWHHLEIVGKMFLVDRRIHDAIKHTGGVALYRMLTGDLDAY